LVISHAIAVVAAELSDRPASSQHTAASGMITLLVWALCFCDCAAMLLPLSRAAIIRSAAASLTAAAPLSPAFAAADAAAAAEKTKALLLQARAQLELVPAQIDDGNWDGIRTVGKTAPRANVKAWVTRYLSEAGEAAEDLVVPREDCVQALSLLDMNVYNNVFTTEQNAQGARGKGVKVDRDTPMRYLRETEAALDEILAFTP